MNLILTKECAKKCSFCFTGDYSKNTEMSLELIEKLIVKQFNTQDSYFQLLGGEPTQHSQFLEILKLLNKYNISYKLVSNILFGDKTLKNIIKYKPESILCNGMELDQKNRIQLFKKNWKFLRRRVHLTLAITLSENSTIEYFETYIKFLIKELEYIPSIRIGLDLSGKYLINNTYIGNIIEIIHKITPLTILSGDCQFPLCIFTERNINILEYIQFNCDVLPLDIFYDESAIYCYQTKNSLKINNILKYNNKELRGQLRYLYKEQEHNNSIYEECKKCNYYLNNQCNSLCLGCYQNDKQYIDIKNIT